MLILERDYLVLEGEERLKFLNQFTPQNVFKGNVLIAPITTRVGKLVSVAKVINLPEKTLLQVPPQTTNNVIKHLEKYNIQKKVKIYKEEFKTYFSDKEEFKTSERIYGIEEIIVESEIPNFFELITKREIPASPPDEYERLRIVFGVPKWGVDIGEEDIPQTAGLQKFIDWKKGCYIGQEVIMRVKTYSEPPRVLRQIISIEEVKPGMKIYKDGGEVGTITSATHYNGKYYALAKLKKTAKEEGTVYVEDKKALVKIPPFLL